MHAPAACNDVTRVLSLHSRGLPHGAKQGRELHCTGETAFQRNGPACVQAGRSQEAKPWAQRAERAILLTGTPATSRPKELYTLVWRQNTCHKACM